MTILCATHFSESSANAVAVAAQLALQSSQRLLLTSVLPDRPAGPSAKEQAVGDALALEAVALREQGLEVETTILHGLVDRAVAELCRDVGAELLVVGDTSHGRKPLAATSVERFAERTEVPLLVVRSKKPFQAWAKGQPLKVVLAVDHAWSARHTREWLFRLASFGALDVVGACVGVPEETRKELQALLSGLPSNVTSRVQLEPGRGRIGALVLALAERERADVVVLGTHSHPGLLERLSSVEHEILGASLMSVALVHETEGAPIAAAPTRWPGEQVYFVNQRRGALSLVTVALVIAAALIGTGVLLEVYRDGAVPPSCELVCRGP